MISLNEEVRSRVASAIDSGNVLTAAYVDTNGRPHISFYGSTHVHSENQLAIWVRSPNSELLKTLTERPWISFIYGSISERVYYTFEGQGRVAEEARETVYDSMHPIERKFDPEKKGVPVIIDLDRFSSMGTAGKVVQERDG